MFGFWFEYVNWRRYFWDHWRNLNTGGLLNIIELSLTLLHIIIEFFEQALSVRVYIEIYKGAITWYLGLGLKSLGQFR